MLRFGLPVTKGFHAITKQSIHRQIENIADFGSKSGGFSTVGLDILSLQLSFHLFFHQILPLYFNNHGKVDENNYQPAIAQYISISKILNVYPRLQKKIPLVRSGAIFGL